METEEKLGKGKETRNDDKSYFCHSKSIFSSFSEITDLVSCKNWWNQSEEEILNL